MKEVSWMELLNNQDAKLVYLKFINIFKSVFNNCFPLIQK